MKCNKLPDNFCILLQGKNVLTQNIFPAIQSNYLNHKWLSEWVILTAKNVDDDEIKYHIQQLTPSDLMSVKSIDK